MVRVLLLVDTLGSGGTERQLALTARHLPSSIDRRVIALRGGVHLESLRSGGIPVAVESKAFRFDVSPAFAVWRAMCAWKPHIVHSWGLQCSLAAVPASKLLGIPLVESRIQSGTVYQTGRRRSALTRKFADFSIANSLAGLSAYRLPHDRATVIHSAMDPDRLDLAMSLPRPRCRSPFRVIMVGRAVREKDFHSFISAARRLHGSDPGDWLFTAVSYGPMLGALKAASEDLVTAGVMRWEQASEVLPYVAASHVGVLMSHPEVGEGASNVLLEYMACGLPVVSTSVGGSPEIVVEGKTGYLVAGGDVVALVDRLRRLRSDPLGASSLGDSGRRRAETMFGVEEMIARTCQVYESVVHLAAQSRFPGIWSRSFF